LILSVPDEGIPETRRAP